MEEPAPAVSVVISTFRRPHFLNQALDSVYAQTFRDFEVIVADDGSGDEYTSQYSLRPDTKLLCGPEPATGSARTRNLGTRAARGRYIAYLDDDDLWLADKLEAQVRILDDNPDCGLTFCHHTLVDQDAKPLAYQPSPKSPPQDYLRMMVMKNLIKTPSCVLVRRSIIDQCGMFDERLIRSEDWEMWARVSHHCAFHADPTPLVLYRTHSAQKTAGSTTPRRRGQVLVVESIGEWVKSDIPEVLPVVRRSLAFWLQKLSRSEARDGDYRGALRSLSRSIALNPWDYRPYTSLVQVAWYALRGGKAVR